MPDFAFEQDLNGIVAGVDEAGRGPLAGPVVAAAVILDPNNFPEGLNDSKALSEKKRLVLFKALQTCAHIGVGLSEPWEIDQINILQGTFRAMRRAVAHLPLSPDHALIDGNKCPALPCATTAIVKGDSKSLSIAAASIVAKTVRDDLMRRAALRFPGYDLERHKGYPTATHRAQVTQIGPSPVHRWSFSPARDLFKDYG